MMSCAAWDRARERRGSKLRSQGGLQPAIIRLTSALQERVPLDHCPLSHSAL